MTAEANAIRPDYLIITDLSPNGRTPHGAMDLPGSDHVLIARTQVKRKS